MSIDQRVELTELQIADPSGRWAALGFAIADKRLEIGGITIRLGGQGYGITAWALANAHTPTSDIDGLSTAITPNGREPSKPTEHPNGAIGVDHVVVVTSDFVRTSARLEAAGMALRRVRTVGDPADNNSFRQGFRRLGPAILELVEARDAPAGPARFWGLVLVVRDLEALSARLGDHLAPIKPAVQPGRHIATLRASAGLTPMIAFMDPEPE